MGYLSSFECKFCGKKVEGNQDFILAGKFPDSVNRFLMVVPFANFKSKGWGDLYHKGCYFNKTGKVE